MKIKQNPQKILSKVMVVILGLPIFVFLVEQMVELFLILSGKYAASAFVNQLYFGIFVILFGITGILGVMFSPYKAFIKGKAVFIVTITCFFYVGIGLFVLRDKLFDFYPPPIENGWLINEVNSPWETPFMAMGLVGGMGGTLILLVKSKYLFSPKEKFKKTILVVSLGAALVFGVYFVIEAVKDAFDLPVLKTVTVVKKFEDFSAVRHSHLIVNDYILRVSDNTETTDLDVKKYIFDQVHPPQQVDIEIRPRTGNLVKINLKD